MKSGKVRLISFFFKFNERENEMKSTQNISHGCDEYEKMTKETWSCFDLNLMSTKK